MNLDRVIQSFDDQMIQNIVPFKDLMEHISGRMVNIYAYESILNDRETLRLMTCEQDSGMVDMYVATTNLNGTEKRSVLNETNLGLLLHYAPQAYKFAKEIQDSLSLT